MFPIPPPPEVFHHQEEAPWLADSAAVLQPKALLPTPRYCLPPPTYRLPSRPPLFPVPPPGSCLLPPPPLPSEELISPHSWQETLTLPGKGDRWRRTSWTSGDYPNSSPPSLQHTYTRPGSRPRTLVEVPLLPDVVTRSEPQPIKAGRKTVDVLQSTLDPTSRPFTPASFKSSLSLQSNNSYEDTSAVSVKSKSQHEVEEYFSYFGEDGPHSSKACSGSFSTSVLSKAESSIQSHGSFFADDPVEDLKSILPDSDVDTSIDGLKDCLVERKQYSETSTFPDISSNIVAPPPPILPLFASHWSGKSRPPLLPTPKNFPPYGPRSVPAPIYEADEESVSCSLMPNPFFKQHLPAMATSAPVPNFKYKQPFQVEVGETNLLSKRSSMIENLGKKPNVVSMMLLDEKQSSTLPRSSLSMSSCQEDIDHKDNSPQLEKGSLFSEDWDPSFPHLEPCSLLESHPVPDEYMVAKVIGGKLPLIKLGSCHTDLLFFLFYAWVKDTTQLMAAYLLFERGWRYHMVEKVWLARWPGVTPEKKTGDWEEGLYQYFDVKAWRRIPGWFRLKYVELAEKTGVHQEGSINVD